MDAQKMLPANFADALKTMVGLDIYIGCCEGRMCYHGELLEVSMNLVNILENGVKHTVYMNNICFVMLHNEEERFPEPRESVYSILFERFHYFLNKRIEITRVNGSCWAIDGRLEYIENDYLVVFNELEKSVAYIHAVGAFEIKSLRVSEN